MMQHNTIIITAGGIGKRMGASIPKQFLSLSGKPILMHTIEQFYKYDNHLEIIIVLPKNQIEFWKKQCLEMNFTIKHQIIEGGEERFHSVKNGIAHASGKVIGVHDAVRPLVAIEVIKNCFNTAEKNEAAIPVVSVTQSLRALKGAESVAVDRSAYKLVQTPQCFSAFVLKKAYELPYSTTFTDDASVVEKLGHKIHLIEGNEENIKITTPIDLKMAEIVMNNG